MNAKWRSTTFAGGLILLFLGSGCITAHRPYQNVVFEDAIIGDNLVVLARHMKGYTYNRYEALPLAYRILEQQHADARQAEVTSESLIRLEVLLDAPRLIVSNLHTTGFTTNFLRKRYRVLPNPSVLLAYPLFWNWQETNRIELIDFNSISPLHTVVADRSSLLMFSEDNRRFALSWIGTDGSEHRLYAVEDRSLALRGSCDGIMARSNAQASRYVLGTVNADVPAVVWISDVTWRDWASLSFAECQPEVLSSPMKHHQNLLLRKPFCRGSKLLVLCATSVFKSEPQFWVVLNEAGAEVARTSLEEWPFKWHPDAWRWDSSGERVIGIKVRDNAKSVSDLIEAIVIWNINQDEVRVLQ